MLLLHGEGARGRTVVMVLSAVSAPMLRSEPGTLLETVAGMTQSGMQSSSNLALPSISSRLPVKACGTRGVGAAVVLVRCRHCLHPPPHSPRSRR